MRLSATVPSIRNIVLLFHWVFLTTILISVSACQPASNMKATDISQNPQTSHTTTPSNIRSTATVRSPLQSVRTVEAAPRVSMPSAVETQNWRRRVDQKYGFDFLYPKDFWIKEVDANHLQILFKDVALMVGYRFIDENVDLAPRVKKSDLLEGSGFAFMGERITVHEVTGDSGQSQWNAFVYDGGSELVRGRLVFTLRLHNVDERKPLENFSPDELQLFSFIIGSFQAVPQNVTHPVGTKVNLAQLGLEQTQSIEFGLFNPQIASSRYLYQHLINDPELIAKIIHLLDREVTIEAGTDCIEAYEMNFHLADGRQMTFGYGCNGETDGLSRGTARDGSIVLTGSVPTLPEFSTLLQPEIAKAELLRDNNAPPLWKSRIEQSSRQVGPFTLEEYKILDPGRWAPYSLEFKAIIPDAVFSKHASLRQSEGMLPPNMRIEVGGHTIHVEESYDESISQSFAIIKKDGQEVLRIPTRGAAGVSPVRGLWAWNGQWVVEVEGHIVIDGHELNKKLGAEETFDWQIMDGKPFAFFLKDGQMNAWYDGKVYSLGYDMIVHNTCCEAGMFDVGHNAQMVWFYARKEGIWRYVELVLAPGTTQ